MDNMSTTINIKEVMVPLGGIKEFMDQINALEFDTINIESLMVPDRDNYKMLVKELQNNMMRGKHV